MAKMLMIYAKYLDEHTERAHQEYNILYINNILRLNSITWKKTVPFTSVVYCVFFPLNKHFAASSFCRKC